MKITAVQLFEVRGIMDFPGAFWEERLVRPVDVYPEHKSEGARWLDQIDDGHVTIWLNGQKLKGGYALIRTQGGENPRWLFIKMDDEEADARRNPVSTEN